VMPSAFGGKRRPGLNAPGYHLRSVNRAKAFVVVWRGGTILALSLVNGQRLRRER